MIVFHSSLWPKAEQVDFGSNAIVAGAAYHVVRSIEEVQAVGL